MEVMQFNNTIVKVWTNSVEPKALDQIASLCQLPFIHHHLAIMPDVHAG